MQDYKSLHVAAVICVTLVNTQMQLLSVTVLARPAELKYCNLFFCVPFISWILRAWQVRKNNGPQKFEYSSISV